MKRIIIIFTTIAFVFSFTTNAFGVDKKEKKEAPKNDVKADGANQKKKAPASGSQKKYDDFIDLNKNGKDDRSESRKPKPPKANPDNLTQAKSGEKKPALVVPKKDEKKADSSSKKPN